MRHKGGKLTFLATDEKLEADAPCAATPIIAVWTSWICGALAMVRTVRPFTFLAGAGLISLSDMVAKRISGEKVQSRGNHLTHLLFAPIWRGQVVTEMETEIGKMIPPVDSHRFYSFRGRRH